MGVEFQRFSALEKFYPILPIGAQNFIGIDQNPFLNPFSLLFLLRNTFSASNRAVPIHLPLI
jgi:hypothetical protein